MQKYKCNANLITDVFFKIVAVLKYITNKRKYHFSFEKMSYETYVFALLIRRQVPKHILNLY